MIEAFPAIKYEIQMMVDLKNEAWAQQKELATMHADLEYIKKLKKSFYLLQQEVKQVKKQDDKRKGIKQPLKNYYFVKDLEVESMSEMSSDSSLSIMSGMSSVHKSKMSKQAYKNKE